MSIVQLSIRFKSEEVKVIDQLIEAGEFGTRTEFIQYAVRKMIKNFEGGGTRMGPPPKD